MLDQADDKVPTNTAGLRRWPIGFAARSATLGLVAATLMTAAAAQSVTTMYGYSRATLSGIPGDPRGAQGSSVFPPRYYLYVEVKPGSTVSARWAWVGGAYYDCTLKKVSTPVQVE